MAYSKIGFHIGTPSNATGYGDYIRALDAAGIPTVCMSVGGEGLGDIIAQWDQGSTVEHTAVVRYMPPPGHPDGNQDVPRYDMEPEAAFVRFWAWVKPLIGADVKRYSQRIVIKIGNELDKAQSEWLAEFYLVGYDIMQSDPDGAFRLGAFSFAAGEPEPEHWRGPKMRQYLQLCADDPIGASIVLHEYSYANTLQFESPYRIGRFQDLFAACDEFGIKRPYVYIHEWGWEQGTIPGQSEAMAQLPWVSELYAKYPEIRGAGLWTLQNVGGYNDPDTGKHISEQAQPLIEPIKNYTLAARFSDPVEPPEEPEEPPDGEEQTMEHTFETSRSSTVNKVWHLNKTGRTVTIYFQRSQGGCLTESLPSVEVPIPDGAAVHSVYVDVTGSQTIEVPDEPTNPNPPPVVLNPLPQGALFADVSANNKLVNLATLQAQGVQGVGIRLSNGIRKNTDTTDANGVDKMAQHYVEEAEFLGMPWLGYHYSNENYDDVEQVRHFLGIANQFIADGHIPEMGLKIDFETPKLPVQGSPTTETRIQQQLTTLANERPSIIGDYGPYTSAGWWNGKVPNAAVWVPALGLKSWVAAWVPEATLVNGWPPSWWKPSPLKGFTDVHYWQWTSVGGDLVGHSVDSLDLNFVGNTAVVPGKQPDPPTPPPTGPTVDTLPYFQPTGTHGRPVVFHFTDGRTQPQQMEKLLDGRTILWKGEGMLIDGKMVYDYEEILVDTDGVKKFKDTSSGGRTAYDLGGVTWLPRIVEIGKVYESSPTVREFDRVNCQQTAVNQTTDYIYVKELLPVWTSPVDPSISFESVLVCEWRKTPDTTTPPIEIYKLAKNVLYCEWNNGAVGELPEGRQPLSFDLTDCA